MESSPGGMELSAQKCMIVNPTVGNINYKVQKSTSCQEVTGVVRIYLYVFY